MKEKLRLVLGTLFVLCVLALIPAPSAEAAATVGNLNPQNHWITAGSGYSVMLKTNHKLYYKYNGKTSGISSDVYCAAVNGTQIAYMKKSDWTPRIVLYDLKTKKSKTYIPSSGDFVMDPTSIALYNGYIYYAFRDDCNDFRIGCLKASTMKTASNTCFSCLQSSSGTIKSAFYQNGQYLICVEGRGDLGSGGCLRVLDMKTGKITKTISKKCCLFAVVGSTLYFVDVTPGTEKNNYYDKFGVYSCTLTGGSIKKYLTFSSSAKATYTSDGFAFHGGKVIVHNTYTKKYLDYTLSTGKYTNSTEANFEYMYNAYFHLCEGYHQVN